MKYILNFSRSFMSTGEKITSTWRKFVRREMANEDLNNKITVFLRSTTRMFNICWWEILSAHSLPEDWKSTSCSFVCFEKSTFCNSWGRWNDHCVLFRVRGVLMTYLFNILGDFSFIVQPRNCCEVEFTSIFRSCKKARRIITMP